MKRIVLAALALAPLLLTACGGVPAHRYYLVETRPQPAPPVSDGLTVGVAPFHVDPPYDQDRIVYRLAADASQIDFYPYDRWAAPLNRMLPVAVADGLQGMTGVRSLAPMMPGRDYETQLHGRVIALEEIDEADGPRVRLHLALELIDSQGDISWSAELAGTQGVPAKTVEQIVEAMSTLLTAELQRIRPDLQAALDGLTASAR